MWAHISAITLLQATKITTDIMATITKTPTVPNELVKRAIITCGFVRGDFAQPLTCPEGYNCVESMNKGPTWACCNDVECIDKFGLCMEFGAQGCGAYALPDDTCSSIYGDILRCPVSSPKCLAYTMTTSSGYFSSAYTSLGCGTSSTIIPVLATATNGPNRKTTTRAQPARSTPGVLANPQPTSDTSGGNSGSSGGSNGAIDNGTSSSSKSSSGLSTRAYIAIVGAGLVVIAAIIGIVWWQWRRHKKRVAALNDPNVDKYERESTVTGWSRGVPYGQPPPENEPPRYTPHR